MICPHCKNSIEWVICVSNYYQRQILDADGVLLPEWEDTNDAIGDTLRHECPECFEILTFDQNGNLVK